MSSGLLALLDDVVAIAKVAAASVDDVAAGALKATSNAAGVVIDDAAVTPKYVVGLSPSRELPIVWNIAKGSLKNKLLILLPVIMLLGYLAPWSIQPLLALGALYLCFEGYEKLHQAAHRLWSSNPQAAQPIETATSPEQLEKHRTAGAIRTDFVLSAEIMAIGYATVQADSFFVRLLALVAVALCITAGVYGVVGLLLKADDVGLRMAHPDRSPTMQRLGKLLVHQMPTILKLLSAVGTAAMLWVGGGIIVHSIAPLHHLVEHATEGLDSGFLRWIVHATISLILAIPIGYCVDLLVRFTQNLIASKTGWNSFKAW